MAGAYAPVGTGGGADVRWRVLAQARRDALVDLGDGIERGEDRAADGRPATGGQARDDVEQDLLVVRRRLDDLGEPGERDDPDLGARTLALDERRRRGLRGEQSVGRDVGRAHAPRHVHREDDGRLAGRQADDVHRPGHGDREGADREHEQRERQVAPDPRGAGRRLADQRKTGIPQPGTSAPQVPDPDGDQDRHQAEQQEERRRQQVRHGSRPSQARDATPPTSRTSRPTPAKSEVTSIGSGLVTSLVSMRS